MTSETPSARSLRLEVWGRSAVLIALGGLALAGGVLVYLTDRAASRALWIPGIHLPLNGSLSRSLSGPLFGPVGQWLPSFVHPFAFSLFTAAALPPGFVSARRACVAWCVVNIVFELGQLRPVGVFLAEAMRGPLGRTPAVTQLANYFLRGTFDPGDIVAAVLGALAAAVVLSRFQQPATESHHAH